jgi:hypothetical protein
MISGARGGHSIIYYLSISATNFSGIDCRAGAVWVAIRDRKALKRREELMRLAKIGGEYYLYQTCEVWISYKKIQFTGL